MKIEVSLEVGDVVFLTSDLDQTTPMTVEDVTDCECGIQAVEVVWADYGEIKRDSFPVDCLSVIIEE